MAFPLGQNAPGFCERRQGLTARNIPACSTDWPSGVPIILENVLVIPRGPMVTGEPAVVESHGLWEGPKDSSAFLGGALVYWNASALQFTSDNTKPLAGYVPVDRPAASTDATVYVELDPVIALAMAAAVTVDTTALTTHVNRATGAHAGTAISFTPVGTIESTNVSAAIAEVSGDLTDHVNDTTNAHAASAIGVTAAGTITSTTAAAAINEIDGDITATRGAYLVEFTGGNSTSAPVAIALTMGRTSVVPAAGDEVKWVRGFVTLTGVPVAMPVVGTSFGVALVSSSGVKINQLQAAGDLSLNTYYAEIIPVRPTP